MTAAWRAALVRLAVAAGIVLLLFGRDAIDLMAQWNRSTFAHCWFIPPVIGWLVWRRRGVLATITPTTWAPGLLIVAAGALAWFVGDAAIVALFRHAGLVVMLQGLVVTLLGRRVALTLAFPIAYALFLIPFGEELVPPMQTATAKMAMALLRLSSIPAYIDGVFITTPGGYFAVAEACSGVKFLVAMAALSVLAAHLLFQRWWRRIVFVGFAMVTAALANGVRAWGTIAMAEAWGNRFAVGADHVIYGWIFFALVIALIGWVASPWFDRDADDIGVTAEGAASIGIGRVLPPWITLALALLIAALPLGWSLLARTQAEALPPAATPAIGAWRVQPMVAANPPWRPRFAGAARLDCHRYGAPAEAPVDVCVAAYDRQSEGRELVGYGQGAVDPDSEWHWGQSLAPIGTARVDRIANAGVERDVMTLYVLGGEVTASPRRVKWLTLRARLTGGDERGYAVLLSAPLAEGGRQAIARLVAAGGGADALAHDLTDQAVAPKAAR